MIIVNYLQIHCTVVVLIFLMYKHEVKLIYHLCVNSTIVHVCSPYYQSPGQHTPDVLCTHCLETRILNFFLDNVYSTLLTTVHLTSPPSLGNFCCLWELR